MAVVEAAYKAESAQDGFSPSVDIRCRIFEADTLAEAMSALYAQTPAYWNLYGDSTVILPKAGIACERLTESGCWDGVVTYQVQSAPTVAPPDSAPEFSFDTSGETKHIHSGFTQTGYPKGASPNFGTALGVSRDGIEGTDIIVPGYRWSETHYLSQAFVNSNYKILLADFTGTVHGDDDGTQPGPFRGFPSGEVLFLGAQGSLRGSGDWQITYSFARLPNESNLTVGDITVEKKNGWQYLWIRTAERKIGEMPPHQVVAHVPSYVYVADVYRSRDFEELGIGTDPI